MSLIDATIFPPSREPCSVCGSVNPTHVRMRELAHVVITRESDVDDPEHIYATAEKIANARSNRGYKAAREGFSRTFYSDGRIELTTLVYVNAKCLDRKPA